jgi:dihydropyrimidinase
METIAKDGVTSFKLFMAYPGLFLLDDGSIYETMRRAADIGALICMHAENGSVIDVMVAKALAAGRTEPKHHCLSRPSRSEGEATSRAIALAEMAGSPVYIVHLTAAEALAAVTEARDRGLPAWAETCPQYLYCSYEEHIDRPDFSGAGYICSPPIRHQWHQDHLWRGLRENDLQVVSTDHCPFPMAGAKELGKDDFSKIPNGMPGIETRMHLIHDGGVRQGRFSMNRFVEVTSTAAAKIFGLFPRKGTVAVGSDADLVIWDPEKALILSHENLHMNVDYSPYQGMEVVGAPERVYVRGELVVDNDTFVGRPGFGRFLERDRYSM